MADGAGVRACGGRAVRCVTGAARRVRWASSQVRDGSGEARAVRRQPNSARNFLCGRWPARLPDHQLGQGR